MNKQKKYKVSWDTCKNINLIDPGLALFPVL